MINSTIYSMFEPETDSEEEAVNYPNLQIHVSEL